MTELSSPANRRRAFGDDLRTNPMASPGGNHLPALLDYQPVRATANHQSDHDRLRGGYRLGIGLSLVAAGWRSSGGLEMRRMTK